ncbi:GroES-like protein [Aureobasidium pullulans]|uniref:GroES-like protein n=1 Tax=Aureobasidium pullulans TaxID=5580 RepID=A0A4T0BE60_AURPU|nr:GroES-like protein [Aureobasidium pullulans]
MSSNGTMRGVVWQGYPNNVSVVDLPIPTIINATDAIVKVTYAGICGTDLHVYHGVYGGSQPLPWGMGHEAVGYVESIGSAVEYNKPGDFVIIPDSASNGHFHMHEEAPLAYGLGMDLDGLNSTNATQSIVNSTSTTDADYLMVGDIWGTAWGGLEYAGFETGDTVAVFGCGPVGLLGIYSAFLRGARAVYAVDHVASRLAMAASLGAIPINFADVDPVQEILRYEPDGVRRSVDYIGFEAVNDSLQPQENVVIRNMIAVTGSRGGLGGVGIFSSGQNGTATPLAGTLSGDIDFPMADFFTKGLSMQSGPVPIQDYAPQLVDLIASGKANPGFIVSSVVSIEDAPEAYARFNEHEEIKRSKAAFQPQAKYGIGNVPDLTLQRVIAEFVSCLSDSASLVVQLSNTGFAAVDLACNPSCLSSPLSRHKNYIIRVGDNDFSRTYANFADAYWLVHSSHLNSIFTSPHLAPGREQRVVVRNCTVKIVTYTIDDSSSYTSQPGVLCHYITPDCAVCATVIVDDYDVAISNILDEVTNAF